MRSDQSRMGKVRSRDLATPRRGSGRERSGMEKNPPEDD
jgi:hypothetical protein